MVIAGEKNLYEFNRNLLRILLSSTHPAGASYFVTLPKMLIILIFCRFSYASKRPVAFLCVCVSAR